MLDSPTPTFAQHYHLRTCGIFFVAALGIGSVAWLVIAVRDAREAVKASQCGARMSQMHLALHNYHDTYGSLPPAYIADAGGKPMHSWRVLLLPFLDGQSIYVEYRFDEPWNSPHNLALARRFTNERFHCPSGPHDITDMMTNYVVMVGADTAFPGTDVVNFAQITDGMDQTILLAEIRNSDIHWMEPRDLRVDQMSFQVDDRTRPSISSPHRVGPAVVFADSIRTYRLDRGLRPATLRGLTTIAGHEPLTKESLIRPDDMPPIVLTE